MKKPDKIYTLTIAYNDETEEVEYLEESISVEQQNIESRSMLIDFSANYWDEDSIDLITDSYFMAEA